MQSVSAAELRPCPIASGLRHQPVENHLRAAAQGFEVRAGRDEEYRLAVLVASIEDVERVCVHGVQHVLAHDERVTESAEIGLQVDDGTPCSRVGQMKRKVAVQPGHEGWRIE